MKLIRIDFNVQDSVKSLRALLVRLFGAGTHYSQFDEPVTLDLTDCGYLGPLAVVVLCGIRKISMTMRGVEVSLIPPVLAPLLSFCEVSGLLQAFGIGGKPLSNPESSTTQVQNFSEFPIAAVQKIVELVRLELAVSESDEERLGFSLAELLQNVLDHADSPVGGFLCARAFKNEREVRFAVADMGIGLRQSLVNAQKSGRGGSNSADGSPYRFRDDGEAIRLALQAGVSARTSGRNLGQGLPLLVDIVKRNEGSFLLFSRHGRMLLEGSRLDIASIAPPFPGTVTCVRLKIHGSSVRPRPPPTDFWG